MNQNELITKRPASTLIEDVIFKYFPFWPLFLLLSIVFLLGSWLYLKTTQPVYEATATILLSDPSKGSDQNQVSEALNLPVSKNIVENEIEVLHSRRLMEEVVTELNLYAPIYKKGRFKDSIPSYAECPVHIQVKDPEHIKLVRKVPFTLNLAQNTVTIKNVSYPLNQFNTTPYGDLNFKVIKKTSDSSTNNYSFTLLPVKNVTNGNLKALEVNASAKVASIVKLKMLDQEPKRAEDILNTLLTKYTQSTIEYKNQLAKNTIDFIDARLNILTNNIKDAEKQVQNYKSSNGIVNLDDQGKLYMQNVTQNDQRLSDINLQLAALNQVEKYVTTKDNSQGIVPSTLGVSDPTLTKLLDRLYDEEMQYEKLKKTTAENNPILQSVSKQIENIRPSILENIRNQKSTLLLGRSNINNSLNSYNSVLQSIPKKEKGLIDVTRDQSVKNTTYAFLMEKREQAALAYSSSVPDSKIVDTAESSTLPVAPKKSLIYMIALGAAAAFTLFYILFKELFTNKVLFRKEIELNTDLPVVGELAFSNSKALKSPSQNKILEKQLMKISTAAGLMAQGRQNYKLLITSHEENEGKSFVALKLAETLAKNNKRVLLADLDQEKKTISSLFKLDNSHGTMASGIVNDPKILIKNIQPNLDVLSYAKNASEGSSYLSEKEFSQLFDESGRSYDFIIIDSTSLNENASANLISQQCDQTFIVIRHNMTPKTDIKQLDYNPLITSLKNVSLIFNGIKKRGFLRNDLGFGFGYESRK